MIFELIDLIFDLLIIILTMFGGIYITLLLAKEGFIKTNNKRGVRLVNNMQSNIKGLIKTFISIILMLMNIFISVILALGVKPIVHKLNYPLGENYATFASYAIAICLFILFQPYFRLKEKEKQK